MKKHFNIILVLFAIICLVYAPTISNNVYAYEEDIKVSAYGKAEKTVVSDILILNARIELYNLGHDTMSNTYNQVITSLTNLGIDKNDINTTYCCSNYQCINNETAVMCNTIEFDVKITDYNTTKKVCDTINSNDNTKVYGLCYLNSAYKETYDEVLSLAIDNATQKVNNLVVKNMSVKAVFEQPDYNCCCVYKDYVSDEEISNTQDITISAKVKVIFE